MGRGGGKDHNRGDKGRSHRGVLIEINRGPLNGSLRTHISVVLCREETLEKETLKRPQVGRRGYLNSIIEAGWRASHCSSGGEAVHSLSFDPDEW